MLRSAVWQIAGVPIALMLVGMMANRLGRRDNDDSPRRNDWAVGTTVLLMLLATVLKHLGSGGNPSDVGWLIGILLATFFSIDHDRYRSWERDADRVPTRTKRLMVGVILPDVLSLLLLVAYQSQTTGP